MKVVLAPETKSDQPLSDKDDAKQTNSIERWKLNDFCANENRESISRASDGAERAGEIGKGERGKVAPLIWRKITDISASFQSISDVATFFPPSRNSEEIDKGEQRSREADESRSRFPYVSESAHLRQTSERAHNSTMIYIMFC